MMLPAQLSEQAQTFYWRCQRQTQELAEQQSNLKWESIDQVPGRLPDFPIQPAATAGKVCDHPHRKA